MTSVPFDTLAFAQRLEQSGFTADQARGAAAAMADALGPAQLVTREYLDRRIKEVEQLILLSEQRQTIKLGAIVAAGMAVVAALVKLG